MDDKKFTELSEAFAELAKDSYRQILKLRASDDAIVAVLRKYAAKLGVSPDQIAKEYQDEFHERHGRLLVKAEDVNPGLAAELDTRPLPGLESDDPPKERN